MNLFEVKRRVAAVNGDEKKRCELYQEVIAYLASKYNGIDGEILKEVNKLS